VKIERRPFNLFTAILLNKNQIEDAWIVDEKITVFRRFDGSYSFKHHGGEVLDQIIKDKIVRKIEEKS